MFQVRFHGRGGQGVVTAAEPLAEATFSESRPAQAFPSFGELGLDDFAAGFHRDRRGWKVPVDAAPTGKRVLVVGAGPWGGGGRPPPPPPPPPLCPARVS
jgi:hypothetical protein